MGENATSLGIEIIGYIVGIALIWGCYAAGRWMAHRTRSLLAGWGAGVGLFVAIAVLIGPAWNALKHTECENSRDPAACYDGQGGQDY